MSATGQALANLPAATEQRQEFGAMTAKATGMEVATSAAAAHAKAMVESRYVMAMRSPRNWDQVRQDLLRECRRPSFAHNPSAFYRKPIGQGVEGLGIRFVEVALRCMKNVLIETKMVFEDDLIEVHSVSVTDLESNITYPTDVKVTKTVERSKPADDGSFLSVRKNSYNKPVYTVPANDDDLLNKRAALISKAIRTLGLRIIPGDLQDEAEYIIKEIRADEAARDPDSERKRIVDAFGALGIQAEDLAEYLGHDLGKCTPHELTELRGIYGALKEGEATWKSVIENKPAHEKPKAETKPASKSATDKAKQQAAEAQQQQASAQAETPAATPAATDDFVAAMEAEEAKPPLTYAQVADAINKAKTSDDLTSAAELISRVADAAQRKELLQLSNHRMAALHTTGRPVIE